MGTRGWLIFIYQGKYYILWNNNDSYPSYMGREIVKQLVELVKRFHGNIQSACVHWGVLLTELKVAEGSDEDAGHPFNKTLTFTNIEESLHNTSTPVAFMQQPSTEMTIEVDRIFVEYAWEINLDAGSLTMWQPCYGDFKRTWTMKSFYQMLQSSDEYLATWLDDARSFKRVDDKHVQYTQKFMLEYSVVRIQAQMRRCLAVKRALEPGTGVLYLAAKQRFEKRRLQEVVAEEPVRNVQSRNV